MVAKIREDGPDEGKKKIVVQASGDGGYDEWLASLKGDRAPYSLLRLITGDRESKRFKFVIILWFGPSLGMVSTRSKLQSMVCCDVHKVLSASERAGKMYSILLQP